MFVPLRNHAGPDAPRPGGRATIAGFFCWSQVPRSADAQSRLNRVKFNLASTDAPLPRVPILPDYVTDVRPGIPCYSPITR